MTTFEEDLETFSNLLLKARELFSPQAVAIDAPVEVALQLLTEVCLVLANQFETGRLDEKTTPEQIPDRRLIFKSGSTLGFDQECEVPEEPWFEETFRGNPLTSLPLDVYKTRRKPRKLFWDPKVSKFFRALARAAVHLRCHRTDLFMRLVPAARKVAPTQASAWYHRRQRHRKGSHKTHSKD